MTVRKIKYSIVLQSPIIVDLSVYIAAEPVQNLVVMLKEQEFDDDSNHYRRYVSCCESVQSLNLILISSGLRSVRKSLRRLDIGQCFS